MCFLTLATVLSACTDRADMYYGARLHPLSHLPTDPGFLATTTPPLGTIAREDDLTPPTKPELSLALLKRGQARFDIYCTPCHARDGFGTGIVVQHGFPAPPSLHDRTVRPLSDDVYYRVITEGLGKMPSYASDVLPADRWAIVAYIRALQLSQDAPASAIPPGARVLDPSANAQPPEGQP